MSYFDIVKEYMEKAPEDVYTAPDIVDTLYPGLSPYNRTMIVNKVNHALNIGKKFGFFEKLGIEDGKMRWRLIP